jgi:hypothetical protein
MELLSFTPVSSARSALYRLLQCRVCLSIWLVHLGIPLCVLPQWLEARVAVKERKERYHVIATLMAPGEPLDFGVALRVIGVK